VIRWRWLALAGFAFAALGAGSDQRRSGFDQMSPALQAMQRDETRHPGQLWVREGEALWQRAEANGKRCADCHAGGQRLDGVAARYPAMAGERAITLAGRVDQCRQRHLGLAPQGSEGGEVLALTAWLAHRSRGASIVADPRLHAWQARGEALWQRRFGQLNLACAQCHDERAGQRLGGAPIPQAHPTAYPVYRLEWQTLGSLERRLRGCLVGVRAEAFAPGADEWLALEAYLMRRAAGLPHEGVGVRP
jgi:L-cysteine S-thiosulfotransferase